MSVGNLALSGSVRPARSRPAALVTCATLLLACAPATSAPAADLGEPAISRAAEAGLQRMRVQAPSTAADAAATRAATDPSAAEATSDASRRLPAIPRATATDEPLGPRSVSLPAGDAGGLAGQAWAMPIGHASVLIRVNGFTVLVDPNFLRRGERARVFAGFGWARRDDPALDIQSLPRIDLVLLTRLSEDHFDRTVRRHLPRSTPIVAPASVRAELVAMGFSSVHGLAPTRALRFDKGEAWMRIATTPTRPTGPPIVGAMLAESTGSLLQFGRGDDPPDLQVWLSGGTRFDERLADALAATVSGVDLALVQVATPSVLPLPRRAMHENDATRLAERLKPRRAVLLPLDDHGAGSRAPRAVPQIASASAVGGVAAPVRVPRGSLVHLERPQRLAAAGALR
jgi:L-ascorbate metabolism protein UlaG (beta-lactamase superfamily)